MKNFNAFEFQETEIDMNRSRGAKILSAAMMDPGIEAKIKQFQQRHNLQKGTDVIENKN